MAAPRFTKSPPELVARFHVVTGSLPDVERRQMFGYPAVFIGGNLVTSLHQESWVVKVAPDDRERLLRQPGAAPFQPMPGRTMGDFVVLPQDTVSDDGELRRWVKRAVAFGRTLPPKVPNPRTR